MRVRRIGQTVLSLVLVSSLLACGRAEETATPRPAPAAELASMSGAAVPSVGIAPHPDKRIQTAALSLEVQDLGEAERRVVDETEALDGYVQDRRAAGEGEDRTSSLVLRVPAERFEDAVAAVEALGKVLEVTAETEDVSQAYLDLETRLRVKRGVEARLRGILDGRAGKLSEVLEVENELARVVEEVERIQAALHGYDRRIDWSTVKLHLRQRTAMVEAGFRANVADAFRQGIGTFTAVVTGLVYVLSFLAPWLVIGAVVLWGMLRFRRRAAA
jgi:hypothetical protein